MKEMWVRYNVGCTMAFLLAHSAWQIDFEPVGPWMGYAFTDLGAEGCCRSLNALFYLRPVLSAMVQFVHVRAYQNLSCEFQMVNTFIARSGSLHPQTYAVTWCAVTPPVLTFALSVKDVGSHPPLGMKLGSYIWSMYIIWSGYFTRFGCGSRVHNVAVYHSRFVGFHCWT